MQPDSFHRHSSTSGGNQAVVLVRDNQPEKMTVQLICTIFACVVQTSVRWELVVVPHDLNQRCNTKVPHLLKQEVTRGLEDM